MAELGRLAMGGVMSPEGPTNEEYSTNEENYD
jgi:hypothetical protein